LALTFQKVPVGLGKLKYKRRRAFIYRYNVLVSDATGTLTVPSTDLLEITEVVPESGATATITTPRTITITPLSATAIVDVASIASGATGVVSVPCTGAKVGDVFGANCSISLASLNIESVVGAVDAVNITLRNNTAGAIDLASATWTVRRLSAAILVMGRAL
jgi:hypothetical protein